MASRGVPGMAAKTAKQPPVAPMKTRRTRFGKSSAGSVKSSGAKVNDDGEAVASPAAASREKKKRAVAPCFGCLCDPSTTEWAEYATVRGVRHPVGPGDKDHTRLF